MSYVNRKVVGKVKVPIDVTDYEIDCILAGCFEGGSDYWIDKVEVRGGDYKGKEFASEVVGVGGKLIIYIDSGTKELNIDRMINGMNQYYNTYKEPLAFKYMDANDYDIILQYALFGKLVYG